MTTEFYLRQQFGLEGERALVTGGASGIGQAIAIALAQAGADVAITEHRQPGNETIREVEKAGRKAVSISVDLGKLDQAAGHRLVEAAEAALGPLTILVNNAGIIRRAEFHEHAESDWRDVISANLDAVWFLSQAVGKRMRDRRHGRIVMIASLLSFQGGIRVPGYTATKHAVVGLTKALANELAPHAVTVNAIAPGYIETENTKALRDDAERRKQILERIPAGRWGQPSDIAGTAVFLSGAAAAYMNGQVLAVDGGWLAR